MFEGAASVPSTWDSINSWFTPAVFFIILNLMIVTIAFTTSLTNQKRNHQQTPNDPQQQPIARSPSLLQRFKSINLYSYLSQEPSFTTHLNLALDSDTHYPPERNSHQHIPETETQFVSQQTHEPETLKTETQHLPEQISDEEEDDENQPTMDEIYSQLTERHAHRIQSNTKPASGEVPAKLPAKMRKSASVKSVFKRFEEEDIVETRRPATVRESKVKVTEVDEEVDSKADDFINRFKQQLKLQRLDSILKYRR